VAEHVVAQHGVGEPCSQPGEGGPTFEETFGLVGVEAVEVVGDPHRVEVRQHRRQDVLLLVHHDRLEIAPSMTRHWRQPSELHHHPNFTII
jgi:hypothetical protein